MPANLDTSLCIARVYFKVKSDIPRQSVLSLSCGNMTIQNDFFIKSPNTWEEKDILVLIPKYNQPINVSYESNLSVSNMQMNFLYFGKI